MNLAPGAWVPIGVSLAGACEGTMTEVHLVRILKNVFSAQEQELWRVFGSPIRRWVRERYGVLAARLATRTLQRQFGIGVNTATFPSASSIQTTSLWLSWGRSPWGGASVKAE